MDLVLVGAGRIGADCVGEIVDASPDARLALTVDTTEQARSAARFRFGCAVAESLDELPQGNLGDVALLTFSSSGHATAVAAEVALRRGYHVVTTCEESSDPAGPWRQRLDRTARAAGRSIVATGANPGFVMDRLPLALARRSRRAQSVDVTRRVDTSRRRLALVAKTGRGLTRPEFAARAAVGQVGHVGLSISVRLIAEGLCWEISDVCESIEPVMHGDCVAGLHQVAAATGEHDRRILLDLTMAWALEEELDRTLVDGEPSIDNVIEGGFHGDRGTVSCVSDAVARIGRLNPGFVLPSDFVY